MKPGDMIWIAFKDDSDKTIMGNFEFIMETASYIKIKSGKNILTLPFQRVLKIKEKR